MIQSGTRVGIQPFNSLLKTLLYSLISYNSSPDLVDMFITNFHYRRFGFAANDNWKNRETRCYTRNGATSCFDKNMTLEECILTENDECSKPWSYLISYLCG